MRVMSSSARVHFHFACDEDGTTQPGLVRIQLSTGNVSTIVTGTTSCDPTRRTPWGTIRFGEEAGTGGQLYELIDPIHTTGVTLDRTTGTFSGGTGASNLVRRDALARGPGKASACSMTVRRTSPSTTPASAPRMGVPATST